MNTHNHYYREDHKKTILLVDDDEDLIERFREVFELEEFDVYTASNGKEALDMLKTMPESDLPDVIMLDYMMPVMNGEKFSQVRQNDPRLKKIPMVLMTANRNVKEIMHTVHANAYMEKPMDMDYMVRIADNFVHVNDKNQKRILQ